MWWKRKKKAEVLPWYRQLSYKGKMSEAEKRILDSFRMKDKHPAATSDDVLEEVQSYINRLECDIYDLKQDQLAERTIAFIIAGAAWLQIQYFGLPAPSTWTYIVGVALLVIPFFVYRYEWDKNAAEHVPKEIEPGALWPTDEGIRYEWEAQHIVNLRSYEREARRNEIVIGVD